MLYCICVFVAQSMTPKIISKYCIGIAGHKLFLVLIKNQDWRGRNRGAQLVNHSSCKYQSFKAVLIVLDGGSPSRSNTTQLLVNVKDVNDNSPRFYTSLFQESVSENVPTGYSIVRVSSSRVVVWLTYFFFQIALRPLAWINDCYQT